jgi:hypothetical protein
MKIFTRITTLFGLMALLAAPALSDTLILKNGEKISGYFEGGSARIVKFRGADGAVKDYDILSVGELRFGDEKSEAAAAPQSAPAQSASQPVSRSQTTSSGPRLLAGNERVTTPVATNAANAAWSIPTGSKIVIRMIDGINSETSQAGQSFIAVLDEPVSQDGVEVIPRGADIRGRITNSNEAGRVAGAAELGLELTQVIVNGIPYTLSTSEYQQVGEARGGQTARRAAAGAGIGAIIGAIAGGGKGAAIGAGVGGGGATAVQVLTKGEKLNIPSETQLEFTLRAPLVIAGR